MSANSQKRVADVVAQSSLFLSQAKKVKYTSERQRSRSDANNNLTFANPTGVIQTYEDPTLEEWEQYWQRLYRLRRNGELWNYWAPLLVVSDPNALVPPTWLIRIDSVASNRITTNELPRVKGLEFQQILMLLSKQTFATLNSGFTGSGQRDVT